MADSYYSDYRVHRPYLYGPNNLEDDSIDKMINNFNEFFSDPNIAIFKNLNSDSTAPTDYVMNLLRHANATITALAQDRKELNKAQKYFIEEREILICRQASLIQEQGDLIKQRDDLNQELEYFRLQEDHTSETKLAHDEACVLGITDEPAHEHDSSSEFCPGTTPDHISESLDSEDDNLSLELREMRDSKDDHYTLNIMRALWTEVSAKRVKGNESEEEGDDEEEEKEEDQEDEQQEEPEFQENPLSASQYCNYPSAGVQTASSYPVFPYTYTFTPIQAAPSSSTSTRNWVYPASSVEIAPRNYSPTEVSSQQTVESSIPLKRQHDEQLK
ncbi:uncharacterized protein N7483_010810 [Penicillium malachiteum]|uniref:uncharacterized protein n=1 Tax=Penicillium malachiteum TaxID=1324776 RepID=UPI002547032B|nr:uncharacterized protein N7483_010810 [Penicillium malachiteum]KAJ5713629.1 hypothetical protein N7483_010810 [Penicillium malachiteum]